MDIARTGGCLATPPYATYSLEPSFWKGQEARAGETVTVIIVPTYPQQWTAVTTGTALEMIDNRDRVVATGEILSTEGLDDPRWQDRKFDREARNLDEALRRSGIDTF